MLRWPSFFKLVSITNVEMAITFVIFKSTPILCLTLPHTWLGSESLINIYWKDVGVHPSYPPYPNFPEDSPVNSGVIFFLTVSRQTSRLTVVGSWRHTHVLLCPVSAISFNIMIFLIKDYANDFIFFSSLKVGRGRNALLPSFNV
jgi:hypothetical protein